MALLHGQDTNFEFCDGQKKQEHLIPDGRFTGPAMVLRLWWRHRTVVIVVDEVEYVGRSLDLWEQMV